MDIAVDDNQQNIYNTDNPMMSESCNDLKSEETIKVEKDNSTTVTIFFKNKPFENIRFCLDKKFSEILSEFLKEILLILIIIILQYLNMNIIIN